MRVPSRIYSVEVIALERHEEAIMVLEVSMSSRLVDRMMRVMYGDRVHENVALVKQGMYIGELLAGAWLTRNDSRACMKSDRSVM